jgi:hypothetical protein
MSRVNSLTIAIVLNCLIRVSLCGASQEGPCKDPCGTPTVWSDLNVFELRMTVPGQPGDAFWRGRFDEQSHDIQIEVETSDGKTVTKGKILMVGGRVMAVQGPVTEPGYEIDALDAAVLEQQLVVRLLGKVLSGGPPAKQGVQKINHREEKDGIQVVTPSAGGVIQAPWSVSGEVSVVAPDVVEYRLTLTVAGPNSVQAGDTSFAGKLSRSQSAKIDDAMPLDQWTLLGVGVQIRKEANATAYDYGAGPINTKYKTVADIRKKIAQDDYAGEPDRSKNFTGFWKEDCEQAFGLQIMHYGTDGKYSVVFCGPGGCGQPRSDDRITFITNDPEYEIVSESEVKERSSGGWKIYHKCTTDTHPVLKYKEQ